MRNFDYFSFSQGHIDQRGLENLTSFRVSEDGDHLYVYVDKKEDTWEFQLNDEMVEPFTRATIELLSRHFPIQDAQIKSTWEDPENAPFHHNLLTFKINKDIPVQERVRLIRFIFKVLYKVDYDSRFMFETKVSYQDLQKLTHSKLEKCQSMMIYHEGYFLQVELRGWRWRFVLDDEIVAKPFTQDTITLLSKHFSLENPQIESRWGEPKEASFHHNTLTFEVKSDTPIKKLITFIFEKVYDG